MKYYPPVSLSCTPPVLDSVYLFGCRLYTFVHNTHPISVRKIAEENFYKWTNILLQDLQGKEMTRNHCIDILYFTCQQRLLHTHVEIKLREWFWTWQAIKYIVEAFCQIWHSTHIFENKNIVAFYYCRLYAIIILVEGVMVDWDTLCTYHYLNKATTIISTSIIFIMLSFFNIII